EARNRNEAFKNVYWGANRLRLKQTTGCVDLSEVRRAQWIQPLRARQLRSRHRFTSPLHALDIGEGDGGPGGKVQCSVRIAGKRQLVLSLLEDASGRQMDCPVHAQLQRPTALVEGDRIDPGARTAVDAVGSMSTGIDEQVV